MKLFVRVNYEGSEYEDFFELSSFPAIIGRGPHSDCRVMGRFIARDHARIIVQGDALFYESHDCKTLIALNEGTKVPIGSAQLLFSLVGPPLEETKLEKRLVPTAPKRNRFENLLNLKGATILFGIYALLNVLNMPDHFRRNDAWKEAAKSFLAECVLFPVIVFFIVVIIRKINRGEYSWRRSLCFSFLFILSGEIVVLIEKFFCWFRNFEIIWSFGVGNFLLPILMFFLWLNAIGKDSTQKSRLVRAFVTTLVVLGISYSVHFLATGYRSEYEIESCYSITGWHWGDGHSLTEWQTQVEKATKSLD